MKNKSAKVKALRNEWKLSRPPQKPPEHHEHWVWLIAIAGVVALVGYIIMTVQKPVHTPTPTPVIVQPVTPAPTPDAVIKCDPDHSGHHLRWWRDNRGVKNYFWRDETGQRHTWPDPADNCGPMNNVN